MTRKSIEQLIELGIHRNIIDMDDQKIKYLIQNKEYNIDPEERVRAAVYVELVEEYNYSPYNIDFEFPVPRRTPSDYADIVVFNDESHRDNYIVFECKREDLSQQEYIQGIEQGFGYANCLRSKFLVVDKFSERQAYDVANYAPNERDENKILNIPTNYGLIPTYRIQRGGDHDLRRVEFNELATIFKKCHNVIWSGGRLDPGDAFDEMSKILFSKIQDERNTPNSEFYKFQVGQNENEVIVAKRILNLYDEARRIDPNVFSSPINISYSKIKSVVDILQDISLTETDLDSKGQAFEKFLGVVFRGELGQYFTRRQIIEFVVNMLDPTERDVVLDPAVGSGGFLLYCMKHVNDKIRNNYSGNSDLIQRKIFDFSRQNIYGIDINAKIARVAMMDMIVNDDGHTNIECNTGFNSSFTNPNIRFNNFTLIMTNPPFGVKIDRGDREKLGQNNFANFEFGGSKNSQISDILFLEQYKNFLVSDNTRNPRAGIVLQNGVLNNPSNKKVLLWIKLNFKLLGVVALPDFAFRKSGSGMKTCLLFIQKYQNPYEQIGQIPDYHVFFAVANHIGYDSTLRNDINNLPIIFEHYKNRTEDMGNGIFWKKFSELEYRLDPMYYFLQFQVTEYMEDLKSKGHKIVPLSNLLVSLKSGKSPVGGVTRSVGEIPSITVSNLTDDGGFDFSSNLNFVPDSFYEEFIEKYGRLKIMDLIMAKDGATTGKTSIIDEKFPFIDNTSSPANVEAIFSEHVFRLRLKEKVNALYVHAFLNSEIGQKQLDAIISGGAQGGITLSFADGIRIPLIKENDQTKIAYSWINDLHKSEKIKRMYENHIKEMRIGVEDSIKSATPISNEEYNEIMEIT